MKLSGVFAKLTFAKQNVVRILTTTALAGAALAAVPAANAQYVVRRPGPPVMVEPYHDHFYWEHRRIEEERARDWRFHHDFYHRY